MFFNKSKGSEMTLPKTKIVHGVEIKKVPIGVYIKAMRDMEELPKAIAEQCFPGKSMEDVIAMFTSIDQGVLISLIGKLLVVLPEHMINSFCSIIGVDPEKAINEMTPKELLDVGKAYWELNDMTDFFGSVWGLLKTKMLPTLNTGFRNGSLLQKVSASAKQAS